MTRPALAAGPPHREVESGPGERLRRLRKRKKLLREELLVLLVLLLALAVTVAVLATQWLSGPTTSSSLPPAPAGTYLILGGRT
jgi:hypothetical protein